MHQTTRYLLTLFLLFSLLLPSLVAAQGVTTPTYPDAAGEALDWLRTQQQSDGGFGSPGMTAQAVLALAAAGEDVDSWRVGGRSPLDYLALHAQEYIATSWDPASATALLVQAIVAGGGNPYDFGGLDLVKMLPPSGTLGGGSWTLASCILARKALLQSAGLDVQALKNAQLPDGGWEYASGWGADSNTTALAVQALVVAGEPLTSTAIISATEYLKSIQNDDGGFPYQKPSPWGTETDANSTAMVIQALIAAGQNPLGAEWTKAGGNPISALLSLQQTSGAFEWKAGFGDNLMATVQALPALMGRPFPLRGRYLSASRALSWLRTQQQNDGGFGSPNSSPGTTADAILGIVAAGEDPNLWGYIGGLSASAGITTPVDYLAAQADAYTHPYTYTWGTLVYTVTAVAQTGKLAVAATAAEAYDPDTKVFGGVTLTQRLQDNLAWSPADLNNFDRAWAILAFAALNETVPVTLVNELKALQLPDGGWEYASGWGADSNTTALAVQALVAAGEPLTSTSIVSATAYLKSIQNDDGGFPYQKPSLWGTETDANSTAMVIQAIVAAGQNPLAPPAAPDWSTTTTSLMTMTVRSPMGALLHLQDPGGAFNWKAGTPGSQLIATVQALPGVMGRPLPLRFAPQVVSTSPWANVPIRQPVFRAVFNTDMLPTSITTETFTVEGPDGPVPGVVEYYTATRTAVFTPTVILDFATVYTATVKSTVQDARWSTPMGQDYRWWAQTVTPFKIYLPVVLKDS